MDRDVGRIIKQVQALGKLENTLIIFSSDNGPTEQERH
jgi:arylsulfatase A-like enzyme